MTIITMINNNMRVVLGQRGLMFKRGVKLNNEQFDELMNCVNRIATTFEHMHELHKEWHRQNFPDAISGKNYLQKPKKKRKV